MKKIILLSVFMLLLVGCNKISNATNWELQDFSFTDQSGNKFGKSNLEGKVWIADFVFTKCTTVCPPMTANLVKLQKMVKEKGLDVEFVSFSVDPAVDSPDALVSYAKQYNATMDNWHLLTGYTQAEIEKFAMDNFKTIVKKPRDGDQVIHGTDFFLVDRAGTVVKSYSAYQDVPFEEMLNNIKSVQ